MRKLKVRTPKGPEPDSSFVDPLRDGYVVIQESDVGKSTMRLSDTAYHSVSGFIGAVLKGDVGKRVYLSKGVAQVENDQQFQERVRREEMLKLTAEWSRVVNAVFGHDYSGRIFSHPTDMYEVLDFQRRLVYDGGALNTALHAILDSGPDRATYRKRIVEAVIATIAVQASLARVVALQPLERE